MLPTSENPRLEALNGCPYATSVAVAEHFQKHHKNVVRQIRRLQIETPRDFGRLNFEPIDYVDDRYRCQKMYRMTRDGFALLAMGFTGSRALAWKVAYIQAFNDFERRVREAQQAPLTGLGLTRRISTQDYNAVSLNQAQVMDFLWGRIRHDDFERLSVRYIARCLGLAPASVHKVLQKFDCEGLIERHPDDSLIRLKRLRIEAMCSGAESMLYSGGKFARGHAQHKIGDRM